MYAVIFRATIRQLDASYHDMADRLRTLAIERYGCLEFFSLTEGSEEVTISYWPSEAHIQAWKADAEHRLAQRMGLEKWYLAYRVQITEVIREYER